MADENTTPEDKGLNAQGATPEDTGEENSGNGAPAPAAPPKNKAEAEAAEPSKEQTDDEKAAAEAKAAEEAEAAEKAKAEAEAEAENKPLDTDVWGDTGDEVGNSVLTLLQNSGMSPDEAKSIMYDALQTGDVTKVDRDALVEKVGKDKANLIMAGAKSYLADATAKAETILKDVHTTVGGEDNWNAVTTWAKENVSAGELAEYREMIDAGGAKARFAASELASRYNGDANNTTLDAGSGEIMGDNAPPASSRTLTKLEYVAEMKKAHDTGASPAVIQEIKAARARGRAKGI